jgi:hypothetical protein
MMLSVRNRLLSAGCLPGQGADAWFDISQNCPAPAETFPRRGGETTEPPEVAPVGWTAGPRELVMQGFGGLGE